MYLGKDICHQPIENDVEGFQIMWDGPGIFGIIWIHLELFWKHLGSCGVIWDHLGSYASISAHMGSSGIILDQWIISGGHLKGFWERLSQLMRKHRSATVRKTSTKIAISLSVSEDRYHHKGQIWVVAQNAQSTAPVHAK